jgi:replicative DNA helicase
MPIATGVAPPHSVEAERSVLGAVLLVSSSTALRALTVEEGLRPEHFWRDRHRVIFHAMTVMDEAGQPVDVVTLVEHLRSAGKLDEAGGHAGIDELCGVVPALGGIRRYAQIVRDHAIARELLSASYEMQAAVLNHSGTPRELVERAERSIARIAQDARGKTTSFADPEAFADHIFEWLKEERSPGFPVPPEWKTIGDMLSLRRGHLTVIGGFSGTGKSVVAQQLAESVGRGGFRTVIWTNEDTARENFAKYAMRKTGVPSRDTVAHALQPEQLSKVVALLGHLPFGVEESFGLSPLEVARQIENMRPDFAIVDHLHAFTNMSRTEDVDRAMQGFAATAGKADCQIVVVCQLGQERVKQIARPAPVARDLRGSGQIFNLAHTVLLVHREEEEELVDGRQTGRAVKLDAGHLDIVKNKPGGPEGTVPMAFDPFRLRFTERTVYKAPAAASTDPF